MVQDLVQIILTTLTIYSTGVVEQHSEEVRSLPVCISRAAEFVEQEPNEELQQIGYGAGCVVRPQRHV
jgi:hypothetical protein